MRHIREEAKIDARGDVVRDGFEQSVQRQRIPIGGSKPDLAFGGGRRGYVPGPFLKTLLASRSYEGRNETHRPLMSLGCARLKPNPVGQQRLRSTIFPFGPQE